MVDWYRHLSVGKKLLIGYAAVFSVSLLVGGLVVYTLVADIVRHSTEDQLALATANVKNLVRTSVRASIRNHLRAVAEKNAEIAAELHRRYQSGEMTESEAKTLASRLFLGQSIGNTGYIYVLHSNRSLAAHPRIPAGRTLDEEEFLRRQIEEKEGYLEYHWQNPDENQTRPKALYMVYFEPWDWIISASGYRDEFGDLIRLDDVRMGLGDARFGRTGYPFVLDLEGNVVIHPTVEGNMLDAADAVDGRLFVRDMAERRKGVVEYNWKNPGEPEARAKIAVFDIIPELEWLVVSSAYKGEFDSALLPIRAALVATLVLAMILAVPLSFKLSTMFTAPIHRLEECFHKASAGDLSVRMPDPEEPGDEFARMAGYFNVFMDENQESHCKVAESESRLRSFVNNAVEGIYQSLPEGRFLMVNQTMAEMLGYDSPVDMVNSVSNIASQFYTDETDRYNLLQTLDDRDRLVDYETRVLCKDGSSIWCRENCRAVRGENRAIKYYEGTLVDISERKRAEALEREVVKATAANRAKSEFLANVSHELRTPMNAVLGIVDLIRETGLDEEQETLVGILESSGNNLMLLINELLDIARIEAGKLRLTPVPFDLAEVCREVVDDAARNAAKKGLELNLRLGAGLPKTVFSDPGRLRQVLFNLAGNAVKFTDTGTVDVFVEKHPDFNGEIQFTVKDTGIGISEEKQAAMFKRFTQADPSTTRSHGGVGLGLAICKRLVELLGGVIDVESEEGRGATFVFSIKRDLAEVKQEEGGRET